MNSNFLILNLPFPMHEPYVLFFGLSYYMSIPVCVVCKTVEKKKGDSVDILRHIPECGFTSLRHCLPIVLWSEKPLVIIVWWANPE